MNGRPISSHFKKEGIQEKLSSLTYRLQDAIRKTLDDVNIKDKTSGIIASIDDFKQAVIKECSALQVDDNQEEATPTEDEPDGEMTKEYNKDRAFNKKASAMSDDDLEKELNNI